MKHFFLLTLLVFCLQFTHAQSGQLDPTFGDKGIAKTDMGAHFDYSSLAKQVLVNSEGSIYIVLEGPSFVSKRFSGGALDSTYGIDGYSRSVPLTDICAALQPDGKILIAGSTSDNSFAIARIKANGTPDSTFGNNGFRSCELNPRSLAIQNDGKIVAAGYLTNANNDSYFAVARFNNNGSPDNTFNGKGQQTTDFVFKLPPDNPGGDSIEIHNAFANAVAIQADGKIIAGGYAYTGVNNDFAIVRYNANGSPDNAFDGDGRKTTSVGSSDDIGYSLALQADGKIVLGGYASAGSDNHFAVVRYNTNGSLDNTFSGDGKQTVNMGSDMLVGNSVGIQSSGKIIIAGYTLNGTFNDFAVARLNTNGNLDNTFDGDGKLTTDFASSDDYAGSLVIQDDDKILVAGYSFLDNTQHFSIARFNANGDPDNSFNTDGRLIGNFRQGNTMFTSTAIQADGKIVTAGVTWNGLDYDYAVARYNVNGSLDNTFNGDGKEVTDFSAQQDNANAVAIQKDGKIIVAGISSSKFSVARYNANGSLDNTFNGNGKLIISLGFSDICNAVAVQNDGKILVSGYTFIDENFDSAYFAIVRLNSNGTFDDTFSDDGKQLTEFESSPSFASSLAIQPDGKIIQAGRAVLNSRSNFALVRYNINGSLDTSFSHDGQQTSVFGGGGYYGNAVIVQPDGKIVVGGYNEASGGSSSSFAVARYTTNGDLDISFNNVGFNITPVGPHFNFGNSAALNTDGRIGVGGTNDNFTVLLYKKNGNLDNTFSNDGIQATNIGIENSEIKGIAFGNNRLYAAGSGEFPGTLGVVVRYLLEEGGPLPVSLLDFKAVQQNNEVLLQWKVAMQQNLSRFIIERSADGYTFAPIKNITADGWSTLARNYSSVDEQPFRKINFYRLKLVDADDKFSYSNIVAVKIGQDNKLQIFPVPAKNILFVQANGENENATIRIIDAAGRKVKELKALLNGNTSLSIDINAIAPGIYNLVLYKNGETEIQRFIKK